MNLDRRTPRALAVALAFAPALGCASEPEPKAPLTVSASELSLEGLDVAPAGELAGEPFTARTAFYRVERYPERHRVDLYFDDPAPEDCGLPLARSNRRVFLRFPGAQELAAGTVTLEAGADEPPFEVHYEHKVDGKWHGEAGGVGAVAFDAADEDGVVSGRLNVCFDDGRGSCVKGAFRAVPCFTRIDGRLMREGVGLLQPVSEDE